MGAECHEWATHGNRWQLTPRWPVLMVWFVKLSTQFELIRVQLQAEIFGDAATFADGAFTWADGSKLWIGSADQRTDWRKWQGIPVDLVLFDEMPPRGLWREMTFRRRAQRKTRFVIGATATDPENLWAEEELFKPWLAHHAAQGLDEDGALWAQTHPDTWFWSRGGIEDNPGADAEDAAHYEQAASALHPKEARVRRKGGFAHWVGDAVFSDEGLDWMEAESATLSAEFPAVTGTLGEADG